MISLNGNRFKGDENSHISLLSFNAGLLDYRICGISLYQNPPYAGERLKEMPRIIEGAGADIVAIQECYLESHARHLINALSGSYPYYGRRQSGGILSLHNGLLVLSKYRISRSEFFPFKEVTFLERLFGSKGILETVIEVGWIGRLSIFNVHLASGAVDPASRQIENLRCDEIDQLLSACRESAAHGNIPIIMGDLNAAPDLSANNYKLFIDQGWRDAWAIAHADDEDYLLELQGRRALTTTAQFIRGLTLRGWWKKRPRCHDDKEDTDVSTPMTSKTIDIEAGNDFSCNSGLEGNARKESYIINNTLTRELDPNESPGDWNFNKNHLNLERQRFTASAVAKFKNAIHFDLPHTFGLLNRSESEYDYRERKDFTWDPHNPLNQSGPHAACQGLRCDYVFLPPRKISGNLEAFLPAHGDIIFREPMVNVFGWRYCGEVEGDDESTPGCYQCKSKVKFTVTASDHYGLKVVLKRVDVSDEDHGHYLLPSSLLQPMPFREK